MKLERRNCSMVYAGICFCIAVGAHCVESELATVVEAKRLLYDVSKSVGILVQKPQSIALVERRIEPTLGVEVDEVLLQDEGVTIQFLAINGALIQFSRQLDKRDFPVADRSQLSKEVINANVLAMLGKLGLGDFSSGENKFTAGDWSECPAKITPKDSAEDLPICYCLSKTLSYKGIPSLASFFSIKVNSETGELVALSHFPTIGIEDVEPKITVAEAERTASSLIEERGGDSSRRTSRLIIVFPNHAFGKSAVRPVIDIGNQRLAWEITFPLGGNEGEYKVVVYVDAIVGGVIGGRQKNALK